MKTKIITIGIITVLILTSFAIASGLKNINEQTLETEIDHEVHTYDSWPMFHHDLKHTGVSASTAPNTNHVKWTYTTGGPIWESSPAIANDKLYIGSFDDKLYCLDANDGTEIWNYTTGDGIRSSPAVYSNKVYVGSLDGRLYCLDANDGTEIWNYSTGGKIYSSPAVADGKVYFGSDEVFDGVVYCLDANDGTEIWNYETADIILSSPAVHDGKVYISSTADDTLCLDAITGGKIWFYPTYTTFSSPAYYEEKIYVGSKYNDLYCLNDSNHGCWIWDYSTGDDVCSSPAVYDGKVYVGSRDNKLYCLNANNGDEIWTFTTDGDIRSSPAIADGKVYIGSEDGKVYCLDVDDGSKIWSYTTGDCVASSPAVYNGRVYIGSEDGKVYCFEEMPNDPPYEPSDPDPEDGATNVDINTDLSWSGGDPDGDIVVYDIYFSYHAIPTKKIDDHPYTTWDPGTLDYNKKYYWMIIAEDEHGAKTQGPIWNFTTEEEQPNNPPDKPVNNYPPNESTGIETDPELNVSVSDSDGDPMDVTFYQTDEEGMISVIIDTVYDVPSGSYATYTWSGREYETTYYWYTSASDGQASTDSEVWHFTTEPPNQPPNTPSDPNPEDNATDVDIEANLSWTGGDPDPGDTVTYDVYFGGMTNPPPKVSDNQSETYYDPGAMNFNETYCWRIVAWDNHGASTTGPEWNFTTRVNHAPNTPSSPSPSNGSKDVDINADLSWIGGDPDEGDTVTYDVYFGKINPQSNTADGLPKVEGNQSSTTYDPGELEYNTTYYWQIIAWDNYNESTAGPIWSFTTEKPPNQPPKVEIIKPERAVYINNEKKLPRFIRLALIIGDITIEVNATDVDSGIEKVEFYINGKLINTSYEPNEDGLYTYDWTRDRLRFVHVFIIKVVAYDNEENPATAIKKTIVRKYL